MPSVIVITNRKGGTGKTTTAINLAAALAAEGQRILLIDLDTQGHCALGLGQRPKPGQASVHRLLATPGASLTEALVATAYAGLDLIPADSEFQHDLAPDDDQILVRALAEPAIRDRYDAILIDSPPSLDRLLLNALSAAHWALIPFVPHPLAEEGVRQLAKVFFRVAMTSNPNLRLLGLLPVMYDHRIGQHRRVQDLVASQFGQERLLQGIRSDIKLAEAFAAGQPIRHYAPRCRGSLDYQAAVAEIIKRLNSRG
ncbi:MAG: ParA family protein [Halochromatium sp.]|nr:ParA family protein [Halochromatium sp.]